MALNIQSFIGQAARLGEKSSQAITVDTVSGRLGSSKVSFFARRTTAFRAGNFAAWNSFRFSLAQSFGAGALPQDLERIMARGKPLTARTIMQLTRQTQAAARQAAAGEVDAMLAGPQSSDRDYLQGQPRLALLDGVIALRSDPAFTQADAAGRQRLLAASLRAAETRPDDLAADRTALGLSGLADGPTFTAAETSTEDRTKLTQGALKEGDAIGTISRGVDAGAQRYLYVGKKDKGVEPGFLVTKNWLPSHERALTGIMGEDNQIRRLGRAAAEQALADYIRTSAQPPEKRAAAAEAMRFMATMIESDMRRMEAFALIDDDRIQLGDILDLIPEEAFREYAKVTLEDDASRLHTELANAARLHVRENLAEFTTPHVIKLDYNESDRSALTRSLRLPQRVKESHGKFFQFFRRTTVRDANRGAVAEALANDITRALGVPAQRLSLVQGSYRDGRPKLLLDSTFIKGRDNAPYRDFDHFIRDGYLDRDLLKATGHSGQIRSMGQYKIAFLLLGDRDAVGSKGQNKGFVGNSFAAIDPGHSLEGNRVTLRDDFSFTHNGTGFKNFTVFDDCPLSEKMAGWDAIERAIAGGAIDQLFAQYLEQFGGDAGELNFSRQVGEMRQEFEQRHESMRAVLAPRLAIYRGLEGDDPAHPVGPRLVDALENVEKLLSETSPTSPKGAVRLEHLRVTKRVPCAMTRTAAGVTITCGSPGQAEKLEPLLQRFYAAHPESAHAPRLNRMDGTLRVPAEHLEEFLQLFSEDKIRAFKGQ